MDLIIMTFVAGFAMATLVFWPLLHRAHRRLAEAGLTESAAPRGKHALRADRSVASAPAECPAQTAGELPAQAAPQAAGPAAEPPRAGAPVPAPQMPARVDMPELPTDLFERQFEARFNRSRQRLARLRDELKSIN
ncbi:hypothetical protein [Saccharopolyspora rosea]|uniref:hypothetical protein n=1 Tax=Saccharopolyspora rosea TaxID=524884 RepID=UPI0021D8AC64|nr:hypothetical protein [Saccharopolyspora rosea]